MKRFIICISLFSLLTGQVLAAQCHALPKDMAIKAVNILTKHKKLNPIAVVDKYCKACRDEAAIPIVLDSVEAIDFQINGYKKIIVNNKKIDLAYIYLNGENIADMIGCKAVGVSRFL